ncbi:unnamed protein product, partial [Meganyctiphanes norvegica]
FGDKFRSPPLRDNVEAPTNFRKNPVRVAIIHSAPYVDYIKHANGTLEVMGYLPDLLRVLEHELNFTIDWIVVPDNSYGIEDNGTWNGLIGQLVEKKADIAVSPLSYTIGRSQVVDFSPPIDFSTLRVLLRKDGTNAAMDWYTYVSGFHWSVWLSIIGLWLLMGIALAYIARPATHITAYNFLFAFIGALAQQGSEIEPTCLRGRIAFLSYWFGSLLLYSYYTADLTSQLSVVKLQDPFINLKDAIDKGYSISTVRGTSYISDIQQPGAQESLKSLWKQLQTKPNLLVSSMEEGLHLVNTEQKTGFWMDTNSVDYLIKGSCEYVWAGPDYFSEYVNIAYQKKLSFANVISLYLNRASDAGIKEKLLNKYWGGPNACLGGSTFHELGITKTGSAFAFFITSLIASLLCLAAEILYSRYQTTDRRRRTQAWKR